MDTEWSEGDRVTVRDRRVSGWDQGSQPPGPNLSFRQKAGPASGVPCSVRQAGPMQGWGNPGKNNKALSKPHLPPRSHPHNPERREANAGSGSQLTGRQYTWTAALLATLGSQLWSFPGGPVVKTALLLRGSIPGLEIRILQAAQSGQKKKKEIALCFLESG